MYKLVALFGLIIFFQSCLKKQETFEPTNIFDENYDGPPWFEQTDVHTYVDGDDTTLSYVFVFTDDFLKASTNFFIMISEDHWQTRDYIYGASAYKKYDRFSIEWQPAVGVDEWCFQLGLKDPDQIIVAKYDCCLKR